MTKFASYFVKSKNGKIYSDVKSLSVNRKKSNGGKQRFAFKKKNQTQIPA